LSLLLFASSPAVMAEETIEWERLVPRLDESLDPYADMPNDVQWYVLRLVHIRKMKAEGRGNDKLDKLEEGYRAKLENKGYDLDEVLWQKAEFDRLEQENQGKLVENLDGKQVRIAGYLLPTEFAGNRVTEFLLVPTQGACIHTPPPPPNQLIHVLWEPGFENRDLYDPVWVSGRISTGIVEEAVSYRDGSTNVEAGYSVTATRVVAYDN
jgi:hypothetical protein